ncbi:MAG: hypothetical protein K8J31_16645 [Anaerolineae bacterium]|nr:hypothetical protein [Anaerolineae bacterium]
MGIWVTLIGLLLVVLVPRDAPEFVISVCSLGVGLILVVLTLIAHRFLG